MGSKISKSDLEKHCKLHGGSLEDTKKNYWNIRNGTKSANIGRPDTSGKWAAAQLQRAWGDATDIPKLQ